MSVLHIVLCCCALFTVTVQAKPAQRIVALSPHLVEQLYSLGVGDMIVGTTDHADYPEGAKTYLVLAIMPNCRSRKFWR